LHIIPYVDFETHKLMILSHRKILNLRLQPIVEGMS